MTYSQRASGIEPTTRRDRYATSSAENIIKLISFQKGPNGFVRYGTNPVADLDLWIDYLYLLAHAGRGSGKSRGGGYRTLSYVKAWPGSLGLITAPTMKVLRNATLVALARCFTDAGLRQGYHWEYLAKYEEVRMHIEKEGRDTKILLNSTEEPESLRGLDLAWAWMDEPRQSPYEAFLSIQASLRQQGFPHQFWLTTTPVGKEHWLHWVWEPEEHPDIMTNEDLDEGGTYIHMSGRTRDNPFGGEKLYRSLVRTYGENTARARQELAGEFVLMEGLTYSMWDHDYHLKPPKQWPVLPPFRHVAGGIDFGFANPACIIIEGIDSAGRKYLVDGYYKRGATEAEVVNEAKRLQDKWRVEWFASDPSNPSWRKAAQQAGVRVLKAYNRKGSISDISYGLCLCASVLTNRGPLGEQMFFVDPKLTFF